MRIIVFYNPNHLFLSTEHLEKLLPDSKFKYINIDNKLAEFIRNLYDVPESRYSWDKIIL